MTPWSGGGVKGQMEQQRFIRRLTWTLAAGGGGYRCCQRAQNDSKS